MSQVRVLTQVAGKAHPRFVAEASEEIIARKIQRSASGAAALFDDDNTTSLVIGGGSNYTGATIGKSGTTDTFAGNLTVTGSFTVNGTPTTINSTNLAIADQLIIVSAGASSGVDSGIAIERGSTGNDAVILWEEGNDRFEFGTADTTGGTSTPASISAFVPIKAQTLLLAGTAITADAALTVTATAAALTLAAGASSDLTLTARGASTTLNQSGQTALSGFTATSIIGALNELKASGSAAPAVRNTYTNNTGGDLDQGTLVRMTTTASEIDKATASTDAAAANYIGVTAASILDTASGSVVTEGVASVAFVSGLTLNVGDEVFMSATSGLATNAAPSSSGNVVLSLGFVKDASAYTGTAGDLASVQLVRGSKVVV